MKRKTIAGPPDQPTKDEVYSLLYELIVDERYGSRAASEAEKDESYQSACDAVKIRQEALERDSKLVALIAGRDTILSGLVQRIRRESKEAKKVLRLLRAEGLTPKVQAEVSRLVVLVNKE